MVLIVETTNGNLIRRKGNCKQLFKLWSKLLPVIRFGKIICEGTVLARVVR